MTRLQKTGGKDELNMVFMWKLQRTPQHGTKNVKTHIRTTQKKNNKTFVCICLRIVVSNILCCVFLFCLFLSSVGSLSGLSILDCTFGFSNV
jgi:formate/nitrite transporter FocA (FNT family)